MAAAPLAIGLMAASQIAQGVTEMQAANAGAATDRENARRAELDGAYAEEASRRELRAVQGEAIAAMGANGVALGTGSALDILRQNAIDGEYEALSRRYGAAGEAASLRTSARQKKAAGRAALFGGVLRAGAAALTGGADMQSAAAVRRAQLPGGQALPIPAALRG